MLERNLKMPTKTLLKLVSLNGETRGVFNALLFNSVFYKVMEDFKKPENRAVFERLKDK